MKFISKHPWISSILFMTFYLTWYQLLQRIPFEECFLMHTVLDDSIPFLSVFIIPYLLWYIYCYGLMPILLLLHEKESFIRFFLLLSTGLIISMLICTLFPTYTDVRPVLKESSTGFDALVYLVYQLDHPKVIFPSMHAYGAVASHYAICHSPRLRKYRWLSLIMMLSVIAATFFIKQHSIADSIAGTLLGLVLSSLFHHFDHIILRKFSSADDITDQMNQRR